MLSDANFMDSVLGSLPGVNAEDPEIQRALQGLRDDEEPGAQKGKKTMKDDKQDQK